MKLKFEFGGTEYSAASVLEFTKAEQTEFWRELFFYFYPDVDKELYNKLSNDERLRFLNDYFSSLYLKNESIIADKLYKYNNYWQNYENQITEALQDIFGIDLSDKFNDLVCRTTFNPISPRYLDERAFDNFWLESEKGALGIAIHEIIHFVWFYVWQKHFGDDPIEYETPHLKWILSEMVVEPIMRDERLGSINPYYTDRQCVYPYFYTMSIGAMPSLSVPELMRPN